jgi:indolepyruvate ferredoxin oxidoreductase beta subunit
MALAKDPFNVIIGGVGGQGNVLASQILGQMLVARGYLITIGETYGVSQRGGAVMSHLRLSEKDQFSPLIPEGRCDLLVTLEPVEALRILEPSGHPGVMTLINTRPIFPMDVISGNAVYPDVSKVIARIQSLSKKTWSVNATEIALDLGDPIFSNMAILGALSATNTLPMDRRGFEETIKEILPLHKLSDNLKAFDEGSKAVKEL